MSLTAHEPGERIAAARRPTRRKRFALPLGDVEPVPRRVQSEGVGRYQHRYYDPVTGRKIARPS